jgi:hypothetical protein
MVDTATPMRPETGSLDDLAQRIKTYHQGVLEAARNVVGSEEGQEDGEFFDQATMRRRPSNLLVGLF